MITPPNNIETNWSYFLAPALASAALFTGSRLIAGAAGYTAKKVSDYMVEDLSGTDAPSPPGKTKIGQAFDSFGDQLVGFATRDGQTEKKIFWSLVNLGSITYFTTNALFKEWQIVEPPPSPEPSSFIKFSENMGLLHTPTLTENIIHTADKVITNVAEDPSILTGVPVAITITSSLASRVATGALGASAKITGSALNLIGLNGIGQPINNTGDGLINFATKNPMFELQAAQNIRFIKWGYSSIAEPAYNMLPSLPFLPSLSDIKTTFNELPLFPDLNFY